MKEIKFEDLTDREKLIAVASIRETYKQVTQSHFFADSLDYEEILTQVLKRVALMKLVTATDLKDFISNKQ